MRLDARRMGSRVAISLVIAVMIVARAVNILT